MKNLNINALLKYPLADPFMEKRNSRLYRKWMSFVRKERNRLSGGVTISVLLHVLFLVGYWGLADLDVPDSPPIREINFIDLNEEIAVKEPPKQPRHAETGSQTIFTESEQKEAPAEQAAQTAAPRFAGTDRIFLDMSRKQAPIHLEKVEQVAENVAKPGNIINVSSAKGIQNNDKIARPAPISLDVNKDVLLASNSSPQQAMAFAMSKGPKIQLSGKSEQRPVSAGTGGIDIETVPQKLPLNQKELNKKQTQTFITGPLANRQIVRKIIPPFPAWAKRQGVGASISLRFTVMEDGSVRENVLIERTSGSRDWDQLVVKALKEWQFAALQQNGLRHDQTGVITFQFVI